MILKIFFDCLQNGIIIYILRNKRALKAFVGVTWLETCHVEIARENS